MSKNFSKPPTTLIDASLTQSNNRGTELARGTDNLQSDDLGEKNAHANGEHGCKKCMGIALASFSILFRHILPGSLGRRYLLL